MFNSVSGGKKPLYKLDDRPQDMEVDDEPILGVVESLPKPKQRNAVSFIDRPKLTKMKSIRPQKKQLSPEQLPSEPANI